MAHNYIISNFDRCMKNVAAVLVTITTLTFAYSAYAADKVVIVPMSHKKEQDTNLTPGNIKKGIEIFAITGTLGMAWGCRFDTDGKGTWNGWNCYQDCVFAGFVDNDCNVFCLGISANLINSLSSGYNAFCNGDGLPKD